MRLLKVSVLSMTIVAAACGGSNTQAAERTDRATPAADSERIRNAHETPVATSGRAAAAPAAARERDVTIPAGTLLPIVLDTPVGSDTSRVEERVTAHLSRRVTFHGETVLAQGSRVTGVVTDVRRSGRVKGRAHLAVRFDSLSPSGDDQRYPIRAASIGRTAQSTKKKDALEIGAPAAGGALIGALVGGKKGALVGTAVGGGAGAGVVLSTRGKEVHLAKGSALTLKLAAPVTVRVRE
jgi:hypothetical protein